MFLYDEAGISVKDWSEIATKPETTIVAGVRPVMGIVASQDCDAVRSQDIVFFEIRRFQDVEKKCKDTQKPESWKNVITHQARLNQKWFYLPVDHQVGFETKMAVDFQTVFRVPRLELEVRRSELRKGRLNDVAESHFRERVSEFYRRFPYDEWYPLDPQELAAYEREYPETHPYPWQVR
jgi:hypothetical protein